METKQSSPTDTYTIVVILVYHIFFYISIGLAIYAIANLNYTIIFFLIFLTIAQMGYTGRNSIYINFIAPIIARYFKITRIYDDPVGQDQKPLFCFVPHSVFCFGLIVNMNHVDYPPNDKMNTMNGLSSRFALSLPIFGLLFKMWGMKPVDSKNLSSYMKQGRALAIVPGGFEEATLTTPNELRVFIENRKGFIKYAMRHGYKIRPVLILKQHQALQTLDKFTKLRLYLNKFKIPGTIYWSEFGPIMPPNKQFITIIGRAANEGFEVKEGQSPSVQTIEKVHSAYKDEINRLYEKYKNLNGDKPLVFY